MVGTNEFPLPECTGEGCGGDNDICTDSRVHHRNAENRAPVTRNHRSAPRLGWWMGQDPAQYINGASTCRFADSSPVGMVDAWGTSIIGVLEASFKWVGDVVTAAGYWYYAGRMAQVNSAAQRNYYQQIYNGHIPQNVTAGSPEQMQNYANGAHAAAKCATLPGTGGSGYGEPDLPTSPGDYGKSVGKEAAKKAIGEP